MPGGDYDRQLDTSYYPATVANFCMDKYEVSVGRFKKFMSAYENWIAGAVHPAPNAGEHVTGAGSGWQTAWNSKLAASAAVFQDQSHLACDSSLSTWTANNDNLPINCVSWYDAFAFCIWDGGRLATEAEWEYTAGHGQVNSTYPWGRTPEPSNTNAVFGCGWFGDSTCTPTDIAPVGSEPNGDAYWGQSDIAGNMFEWVFDNRQTPYPISCNNCVVNTGSDFIGTGRVIRGGAYDSDASTLTAAYRAGQASNYRASSIGIRCVRTP